MKGFSKKVFFVDCPAQGVFAGFTLLLASCWIVPSLILLKGDFPLGILPFRPTAFPVWCLAGLLVVSLYALTIWIRFYFFRPAMEKGKVPWNSFGRLAFYAVCLFSVLTTGWISSRLSRAGYPVPRLTGAAFLLLQIGILWVPLIKFPGKWIIILIRGMCLLAAIVCSMLTAAVLDFLFLETFLNRTSIFYDIVNPSWLHPAGFAAALLWPSAYLLTAWMYSQLVEIPFRRIFSFQTGIILGVWAAVYLFSLESAYRAHFRSERRITDLEKHFGLPLTVEALLSEYRRNRPVDESFWKQATSCLEKIELLEHGDEISGMIPGIQVAIFPEKMIRRFEKRIDQSAPRKMLEQMLEKRLPTRQYQFRSDLICLDHTEHYSCRTLGCLELWHIRLALSDNRLADAYAGLNRMKRISDYLGSRIISVLSMKSLIACESSRMRGLVFLLSSGKVPDGVLKQWIAELEKAEEIVPRLHLETLYAQAVFCNTYMNQAAGGRFSFAGNFYPGVYILRFFCPSLWYFCTLERYRLMSQFLVKNFDEIPDPKTNPGLLVPAILPFCMPLNREILTLTANYRVLRALIEAELEKRRTGSYPKSLKNPPKDPFTGKPLRYRNGDLTVSESVWIPDKKYNFDLKSAPPVPGIEVVSAGMFGLNDLRAVIVREPGKSVLQAFAEFKNHTIPFDAWIAACAARRFPSWSEAEKLEWLTRIFLLTGKEAEKGLIGCAKKYDLLTKWDQYAMTCPDSLLNADQRKLLRFILSHSSR